MSLRLLVRRTTLLVLLTSVCLLLAFNGSSRAFDAHDVGTKFTVPPSDSHPVSDASARCGLVDLAVVGKLQIGVARGESCTEVLPQASAMPLIAMTSWQVPQTLQAGFTRLQV